jgi:hypothetical protein
VSDSERDADRDANVIRRAAVRAEAEIIQLRTQREFSGTVEPNIGAPAGAEYKRVRAGKASSNLRSVTSSKEKLAERNNSVPLAVRKPRAERVSRDGQTGMRAWSGLVHAEIADKPEPTVGIEGD